MYQNLKPLLKYSIKVQLFNIKQTCFVFNGSAHVIWDTYCSVIKTQILMLRRSIPSGQSRQSLQCLYTQKTMTVLYKHSMGKVRKQAKIKNRYNQVLHPGHRMGKWKKKQENITYKRAKKSALSPQMTSSLHETDMALWQRQTQITKKIHKRSTILERSVRKLLEAFLLWKLILVTL